MKKLGYVISMVFALFFAVQFSHNNAQADPPATPSLIWSFETFGWVTDSDTIRDINQDGVSEIAISVRDFGNSVYLLSGADGREIWRYVPMNNDAPLGIDAHQDINQDGIEEIVVNTLGSPSRVQVLNGQNGEVLWSYTSYFNLATAVESVPDVSGDGINDIATGTGAYGFKVYLINGLTGDLLWEHNISPDRGIQDIGSIQDVDNDQTPDILVGTLSDNANVTMYVLSGRNGSLIRGRPADSYLSMDPIRKVEGTGEDVISSGIHNDGFVRFDSLNGEIQWSFNDGGQCRDFRIAKAIMDVSGDGKVDAIAAPEETSDCSTGKIYMLDGVAGNVIWSFQAMPSQLAENALTTIRDLNGDGKDDVVTTNRNGSTIVALDGRQGELLWSFDAGGIPLTVLAAPDLNGNGKADVIATTQNGYVYALEGGVPRQGGGPCFLAGTPILMGDGTQKNIEFLKVGDKVLAFDEKTKSLKEDGVKEFFEHTADKYLVINKRLKLTENHPLYVNGKWVEAGQLKKGDTLLTQDGKPEKVTSIKMVKKNVKVYNLEVNPYHTYIAGGVVVHNKIMPTRVYDGE